MFYVKSGISTQQGHKMVLLLLGFGFVRDIVSFKKKKILKKVIRKLFSKGIKVVK